MRKFDGDPSEETPPPDRYANLSDRQLLAETQQEIEKHFCFIFIAEYFSQSVFAICALSDLNKAALRRMVR